MREITPSSPAPLLPSTPLGRGVQKGGGGERGALPFESFPKLPGETHPAQAGAQGAGPTPLRPPPPRESRVPAAHKEIARGGGGDPSPTWTLPPLFSVSAFNPLKLNFYLVKFQAKSLFGAPEAGTTEGPAKLRGLQRFARPLTGPGVRPDCAGVRGVHISQRYWRNDPLNLNS